MTTGLFRRAETFSASALRWTASARCARLPRHERRPSEDERAEEDLAQVGVGLNQGAQALVRQLENARPSPGPAPHHDRAVGEEVDITGELPRKPEGHTQAQISSKTSISRSRSLARRWEQDPRHTTQSE